MNKQDRGSLPDDSYPSQPYEGLQPKAAR